MTETLESDVPTKAPKKERIQLDPFTNPGPLAQQEADWLNEKFPGLDIEPKHVRALVSNHTEFQKSDLRKAARDEENQERVNAREARKARHQERLRLAEERREEREKNRRDREAARVEREAEREAKRAEKAAAKEASGDLEAAAAGPKKVKKPAVKKVAPDAPEAF